MTDPTPVTGGRSELTILHLSGIRSGASGRGEAVGDGARLSAGLTELARAEELRPDLMVVTGDLADHALPGEYRQATTFLATVAESVGIPRRHVAIVPGSHDVNRLASEAHFLIQASQGLDPLPPYFPKWQAYRDAFNEFYFGSADYTFTPDEPWTLFEMPDLGVVVAGLNSTVAESHRAEDRYGFVGMEQLRWFESRLAEYQAEGWLRIAAVNDAKPRDTGELAVAWDAPGLVNITLTGQQAFLPDQYEFLTVRPDGLTRYTRRGREPVARPFTDATSVFPPPGGGPQPERPDRYRDVVGAGKQVAPADSFVSQVAAATRVRLPGAVVSEQLSGFPYLRVTMPRENGQAQVFPIGVISGLATEEAIDQFTGVHQRFAAADPGVPSELVYSGVYAPASLVAAARRQGIRLRNFIEYQGLLDLRPLDARQREQLADDRIYPAELYIDQRFTIVTGGSESSTEVRAGLISKITEWLAADERRLILVLGDFGRGKTAFIRQLARELPDELPGVLPVLVELRPLEKAPTLDELLAQHLIRQGVGEFSTSRLRYMIESGRVALLFDGFDELEVRVGYDSAADYLQTLLSSVAGQAKLVLTSRTQHFRSTGQVRTALGERVETRAGSRVVILEDFTEQQILAYLVNLYGGDAERARRRLALLGEIEGLLGLARNPRMLAFVAVLAEDQLYGVRDRQGRLSPAGLYAGIIDHWLENEVARVTHLLGMPALSKGERLEASTSLALRMWRTSQSSISLRDLTAAVADMLTTLAQRDYTEDQAAHAIASGSLLVRTDDDAFAFIHQSVMEWLVAAEAARLLVDTGSVPILNARPMSRLMADFFADLAGHDEANTWARRTLADPRAPQPAKLSALAVLDLPAFSGAAPDLSGIDLRNADLNERDLHGAVLRDALLRDMRLNGVNLAGADLSGADMEGVVLTGGSLRGATLSGSRWNRSAILGTDGSTDPSLAQQPELVPAAIAGRDPAQVMTATSAGSALCLAFSPDGALLAHGSGTQAMITDAETGRTLRLLRGHQGDVAGLAFAPDGSRVAAASDDGAARTWDTLTGEPLSTLTGHEGPVTAIAFSPDGTLIATSSLDQTVRIWDAASGGRLATFTGHRGQIYGVAFSPDGTRIATASHDGTAGTWDARTGQRLAVLAGHEGPVTAVAFSPDALLIATASTDRTARTWDVLTGQPRSTLTGHSGPLTGVAFAPDGALITTGSYDGTVRIWAVADGAARATLADRAGPVTAVTFAPDGTRLATTEYGGTVRIWDVATGQQRTTLSEDVTPVTAMAFAPDGLRFATAESDTVRIWDPVTGRTLGTLAGHAEAVTGVAFSPDSRLVATASGDKTARIWDPATGTAWIVLAGHAEAVTGVGFSPDSRLVATASADFTARVWDSRTGQQLRALVGHQGRVYAVGFSPDGRLVATASHDRTVRLWDASTGAVNASLAGHDGPVAAVAFSPGGRLIATASSDQTARIWAAADWSPPGSPPARLAPLTLRGHASAVQAVAFHPDETLLATGASDATACIWRVDTGELVARLRGHDGPVTGTAFSRDGTLLVTSSEDGTVRLWEIPASTWVATLVPFADGGQAVLLPGGSYKIDGDPGNRLWWSMKLCRFGPGELDPYVPEIRRLPAEAPIAPPHLR